MTEHPAIAAKCTKRQIEVFEQIAVGNTLHPQRIIESLAAKGLVVFQEHKSKDPLGVFSWKEPFVPVDIHYKWCEWCAENFDCED